MVTVKLLVIIKFLLSHKMFGAQMIVCVHVQVQAYMYRWGVIWERGMGLCLVKNGLGENACKGAGLEIVETISK